MASKRRAKRKVDRSNSWRMFWLVAFVSALVAGLVASPLTSPTQIRVSGAARHQEATIARLLRANADRPCLLIDAGALEASLASLSDIRTAALRSNVFGRARLRIQCRRAVAGLGESMAVDETGRTFFLDSRKPPNLQISTNVKDFHTIITISDSNPLNRLSRVAKKIQESLPKVVGTLEFDDRERIRLLIEDLVVEFGDTSDLDAKVGILSSALKENPQRAQQGGSIILVDPED